MAAHRDNYLHSIPRAFQAATAMPLAELVLVNFLSKHITPELEAWQARNQPIYMMSCARQIWLGPAYMFDDLPLKTSGSGSVASLYRGAEAHNHAVQILCGLQTKDEGDLRIFGDFLTKLEAWAKEHPEENAKMRKVMDGIVHDTRLVMTTLLRDFKPAYKALIARDLSQIAHKDDVLIIGGPNKAGVVSDVMHDLVDVLHNRNRRAGEIAFLNPNVGEASKLRTWMRRQQLEGRYKGSVTSSVWGMKDIEWAVPNYPRIFVDISIGANPELDSRLLNAWKEARQERAALIHMRGSSEHQGSLTGEWVNTPGIIGPKEVAAALSKRRQVNDEIRQIGIEAATYCAQERLKGCLPKRIGMMETLGLPDPGRGKGISLLEHFDR